MKQRFSILFLFFFQMIFSQSESVFSFGFGYGFGDEIRKKDYAFSNHFVKLHLDYQLWKTQGLTYALVVQPEVNLLSTNSLTSILCSPVSPIMKILGIVLPGLKTFMSIFWILAWWFASRFRKPWAYMYWEVSVPCLPTPKQKGFPRVLRFQMLLRWAFLSKPMQLILISGRVSAMFPMQAYKVPMRVSIRKI